VQPARGINQHDINSLLNCLLDRIERNRGRVLALPTRADVTLHVEEHLVVELYSK
jgi:ribosomal protein S4